MHTRLFYDVGRICVTCKHIDKRQRELFISYDDSFTNVSLNRIQWRVRYLARGTIRLKNSWGIARIVPQITGKETLCSYFQPETSR